MRSSAALLLVLLACHHASADPSLSPDEEVARREYAAGAEAYDQAAYEIALQHFETARAALPAPALDYNIARCLDRLGRWREAIDAYQRFVDAKPDGPTVAEVHERLTALRARVPAVAPPPAPPSRPPRRRLRLAAGLVLGGTLALAVAGGALYGITYSDYADTRDRCNGACDPASVADVRKDLRDREIASGVLLGLAGAALVADVVLWVLDARAPRALRAAAGGVRF